MPRRGKAASTKERTWHEAGSKNSGKSAQGERPAQPPRCPECASQRIWKDGFRYVATETGEIAIQRYICRDCGRRFSEDTAEKVPALGSRMGANPTGRKDVDLFESYLEPNRRGYNQSERKLRSSSDGYTGTEAGRGGETLPVSNTYQIGVADPEGDRGRKGQVYTLSQKSRIEKRAAGATKLSDADIKGKLVEFTWYLKKQGFAKSTVKQRTAVLRRLVRKGADLMNPDSVKMLLARQDDWSNGYKRNITDCYQKFVEMEGLSWTPPNYKHVERLPFIPHEEEIDSLISGSGKKVATTLQLLKETGMRIGEAWKLEWTDIDEKNHTIKCEPEKGSKPRMFKVSDKLISMLQSLPKENHLVFAGKSLNSHRSNFMRQRRRISKKLQNPRLEKITFHTLRHWKATMEYHRTKDILHVKQLLGHRNIENTMIYTQLVDFEDPEEFTCRVAKTLDEAKELIEAGFEYVTDMNDVKLFKKRK